MENKVLLLGANERACFSVARNLKKHGVVVDVAGWENNPVRYSRFISRFHVLPNLFAGINIFFEAFVELVSKEKYSLVIPVNDAAVEFMFHYRQELEKITALCGINEEGVIKYAQNKYELIRLCRQTGIAAPDTILINSLEEFEQQKNKLVYPLVAKPVTSKKIVGNRMFGYTVRRFSDLLPLEDFIRERIFSVPVMLQQVVEGYGMGFNFISKNGKLIAWYMHERINEPAGGGESSYRRTLIEDKYHIVELSEKLVNEAGWTGVGMIEYKISNGKAYIMELNGRFWGSIELGIFAGLDIPWWQVLYNFQQQVLPDKIVTTNKVVYARNLRNDFLNVVKQRSVKVFFSWIGSLPQTFRSSEIVEDSIFRDFRFRVSMWIELFSKPFKSLLAKWRRSFISLKTNAGKDLDTCKRVVFVCEGNICRSPFAEKYLARIRPDLLVYSAGLQLQDKRMSPLNAVRAAQLFGISLAEHSSMFIGDIPTEEVDIFFVMDKMIFQKLRKRYPASASRILFLDRTAPVKDPYGKQLEYFTDCYSIIKRKIDQLFLK